MSPDQRGQSNLISKAKILLTHDQITLTPLIDRTSMIAAGNKRNFYGS